MYIIAIRFIGATKDVTIITQAWPSISQLLEASEMVKFYTILHEGKWIRPDVHPGKLKLSLPRS